MSRSSMTTILLRLKRTTWFPSLVLLAAFDQINHFLLLKHFPLGLPFCFILLIFLLPQIAFFMAYFYCISCWRNLVHDTFYFSVYIFFLGDSLWSYALIYHICWQFPNLSLPLTFPLSSSFKYATVPLASLFRCLLDFSNQKSPNRTFSDTDYKM